MWLLQVTLIYRKPVQVEYPSQIEINPTSKFAAEKQN